MSFLRILVRELKRVIFTTFFQSSFTIITLDILSRTTKKMDCFAIDFLTYWGFFFDPHQKSTTFCPVYALDILLVNYRIKVLAMSSLNVL